ncbi:MAG: SWIM zinc finger family protein [Oscillospiraceae bacterium]|nr:SWIM zinc finger family protein [Oscillospiraceae bacterium]
MKITEQYILLQAPNAAAASNGRNLSRKGSFSNHGRNEDSNIYWAECAGSGKNPYRTSIDFSLSETAPTCRCSCPSRQFPCKHAVGLMYEIMAEKPFNVGELPADLAEKKAKQEARAAKKEEKEAQPAKAKKTNTSAQKKKIAKQLEGLDLAEKLVDELLTSGIGTLAGTSAQAFEKVAKDLGNYYLTGPQNAFTRIALEVRKIQQNPEQAGVHYAEALRILVSLHATIKKARVFLNGKLDSGDYSAEDSLLYEALGGVWRLEDLRAIGSYRENVRLIQLSFDVSYDEAKKEYVERGFWLDLDHGSIGQTLNYRPVKALKYVKADDSCFEVLEIPVLYEYPGELNKRIRWDGCTTRKATDGEMGKLPKLAASGIAEAVKTAKGQMKNTLLPKFIPSLLPVGQIGIVGDSAVLEDPAGNRIVLRDRREDGADHASVHRLKALPMDLPEGGAIFGLVFYDAADHRICLHPYSIVTPDRVIRLQY